MAIDGVNRTSDSMTNTAVIFVAEGCPGGEKAVEKSFTNHIYADLRGRDFDALNRWFVSRRGASLDAGTDIIFINLKAKPLEPIFSIQRYTTPALKPH